MIKTLQINRFNGGTGSFEKIGPEHSGSDMTMDIFEDPSYMTLPRASSKLSGSTVTDLPIWAVDGSPFDTNRYFYDLSGKLYKETSGAVWSNIRTVSGATGEGLAIFDDYLYYMTPTDIGRYGPLSGTPTFNDSLTSWWDGALTDIQTTGGGTGQTYATATSIAETATHRQTFTATHDPVKSIVIDINDTGDSADWTVTLHDSEDNVIGTKTTLFASITTGDNTFTFATPPRTVIGNEYHFHVTTTNTTGAPKVTSNVASDLEGAEFTINYGVLIDAEFHQPIIVEDKLIIANGPYLAVFDQSTYNPNAVLLERGFEVRTMTKMDEFVVAGAYKGSSILNSEEARLFYWNTIDASWNFFTDTTSIGAPNALTSTGNKLRGVYGNRGGLYEGDKPFKSLLNKMPTLPKGKTVNVYPSALSGLENITLLGIGGATTSGAETDPIRIGVYGFGAQEGILPDSFAFLYRMSTGSMTGQNLAIGFVAVFGTDIYFSWRDGANYGVDKVAIDAVAATPASYDSLLFDDGDSKKEKLATEITASFRALAAGETVTVGYKLDGETSFTSGTAAGVGETRASVALYKRFREMAANVTVTSSNGTFPKVTELAIHYDPLTEERVTR